jgi:hypothetical protein
MEEGNGEEDGISVMDASFWDFVFVQDEIFSQDSGSVEEMGDGCRGLLGSLERVWFGQDGDEGYA